MFIWYDTILGVVGSIDTLALLVLLLMPGEAPPTRALVIRSTSHPVQGEAVEGFEAHCDCQVEVIVLQGDADADRSQVRALLKRDPPVLVALGQAAAEAVAAVAPKRRFLAAFLDRPQLFATAGGVLTEPRAELELEQLLRLKKAVKRLGVLYDSGLSRAAAEDVEKAAKERGLTVIMAAVDGPTAVPRLFRDISARIDALLVIPTGSIVSSREALSFLVLGCFEKDILLYTRSEALVKGGVLFTLAADPREVGESLADMAKKVLSGFDPAAMEGFQRPSRYELILNQHTALNLGLDLSSLGGTTSGELLRLELRPKGGVIEAAPVELVPARVVKKSSPQLPKGATGDHPMVVLRLRIGGDGKVLDSFVLTGEERLAAAASKAVLDWTFSPATQNGRPVESSLVVTVSFGNGN